MKSSDAAEAFVCVAKVASNLFKARKIAQDLSITSKNARALAARAGSSAAGFNEITQFIESLSKVTIDTAGAVNRQAVELTSSAASLFRVEIMLGKLAKVMQATETTEASLLSIKNREIGQSHEGLQYQINQQTQDLTSQIINARNELRATQVVSVVAKIEAAQANEAFQASLYSVADKVVDAGDAISSHMKDSEQLLETLR